jgi:hypothetical protein
MIIRPVHDLVPPLAALLPHKPGAYAVLILIGLGAGVLGHLIRLRWLVAVGIVLVFLGALLFPLAVNLTTPNRPPPVQTSP